MAEAKKSTAKSETADPIEKAREEGRIEARKQMGEWIEKHMLTGPYRTVYSDIFPSIVKRLKEGKAL